MREANLFKKILRGEYFWEYFWERSKGVPLGHKNKYHNLFELPKNSICAEIGVWAGDFSGEILEITNPKLMYLIDPCPNKKQYYHILSRFIKEIKNKKIRVIRDCIEYAYNKEKIEDNYFDWVYLDTFHGYYETLTQLDICYNIVKVNGLIVGDDCKNPPYPNVEKALIKFIEKGGVKVVYFEKNFQYCLRKLKNETRPISFKHYEPGLFPGRAGERTKLSV